MLQEAIPFKQTESKASIGFPENKEFRGFRSAFSDYLGLSGSFLCLIHCIAPQLLFLGSMGIGFSTFFSGTAWHLFFWITCLVAAWQSSRITSISMVKVGLWFSLMLFSVGIFIDLILEIENVVSYVGSVLLVLTHGYNLFGSRKLVRSQA